MAGDLSSIELSDGGALIHPSSMRIKLWREAVEHFGWQDRILQRDYYREDKFHCTVPAHHAGSEALPLSAVVLLEDAQVTDLERLTGFAALEAVMRGTLYRPEMLDALGQWGVQGGLAARALGGVPVWRWKRPKTYTPASLTAPMATILAS